ncbi:M23 family metallopeptidase [Novosphingobium sp. 1949]|uniref:M23 family metallopeptidase n=1 Tax=Novosphingobium organovorum TaxID=2930092 RepID=A0ABT0BCQ7_9SPHN|nr:M23 family metallopeptidase [Novosphingobium organovorum]MCJ2182839.1 M23 family metallopeptidase [Novosphingobium organovorum]
MNRLVSKVRALRAAGGLAACALGVLAVGASFVGGPRVEAASAAPLGHPGKLTYSGEDTQGGWIRGVAPKGTVSLTLDGEAVGIDPQTGAWFAAFDRDAKPSEALVARMADGTTIEQSVAIAPRDWHIERINLPMHKGGPSAAFMKIRQPELDQIHAARALATDAQGWKQRFIWPVKGRISGQFGSQRFYQGIPGAYHTGIDIAPGRSGDPIVAPADGVVILAAEQPFSLEGHLLMIDHGNGLNSAFLHCSQLKVHVGDHVKQGQVVANVGMSGRATGPHLHWSLMWKDARVDPILFTGPMN